MRHDGGLLIPEELQLLERFRIPALLGFKVWNFRDSLAAFIPNVRGMTILVICGPQSLLNYMQWSTMHHIVSNNFRSTLDRARWHGVIVVGAICCFGSSA